MMRLLAGKVVFLLVLAALAAGLLPAAASPLPQTSLKARLGMETAGSNHYSPEMNNHFINGWYFYHEIVTVSLTFQDELFIAYPVTVQGAPYLELVIGDAPDVEQTRRATYHSGSGSTKLLFQYRVQKGDYDADGISFPENALKLNSGSITATRVVNPDIDGIYQDLHLHKVVGSQGDSPPLYDSKRGDDRVYEIGTPIPELTLPAASGGNGPLVYSAHLNAIGHCGPAASGSSPSVSSGGAVGGSSSSPTNLRDWMIYTPPGPGDTHGGKISATPGDAPNTFKAPTTGLHGCLVITVKDSDNETGHRDQDQHIFSITVKFNYDSDGNGLIEVSKLSQLDAIRYDLDGDGAQGTVSDTDWAKYTAAFPDAMLGMGCPDTAADADTDPGPCTGYELTASLNLSGYNGGASWQPIGDAAAPFTATFTGKDGAGNYHTIANLFINVSATASSSVGLFGVIGSGGQVKDVGLLKVNAALKRTVGNPGGTYLGGLAGRNYGTVTGSYATGAVNGSITRASTAEAPAFGFNLGGLLGRNDGTVESSYSAVSVIATGRDDSALSERDNLRAGGLVGRNAGAITASYAIGQVQLAHGRDAGGLAGANTGPITASYATGAVAATGSPRGAGGLVGYNWNSDGRITASYAAGLVTTEVNSNAAGGLIGVGDGQATTDSYWDTGTTGQSASIGGVGKTTRELQTPTGYTGIYANWDLDIDGDTTTGEGGKDKPWHFGTAHQYPVLQYGNLSVEQQRRNFLSTDNWGAPAVGDPVSATAPASAIWQWQREADEAWINITVPTTTRATASTYVPTAADVGKRLRAIATYTEGGITQTLTTANTGAVVAVSSVMAGAPAPLPVVGEKLRYGIGAAGATDIQTWHWRRCDDLAMTTNCQAVTATVLTNKAHSEYTPTAGAGDATDVGKYLQAHVYYAASDAAKTWTRATTPVMGPVAAAAASSSSGPTGS